jgi:hypothetical protein
MKNLLSKIFNKKEKPKEEKLIKEIGEAPKIELGQKFDIYISVLETGRSNEKDLRQGRFVLLDGIKGVFKIEEMYELGHSAQYRLELIRENLPKDYNKEIEKIENYSTNYQTDSFNIMP